MYRIPIGNSPIILASLVEIKNLRIVGRNIE